MTHENRTGDGRSAGEKHGAARLTVMDVALARLIAADRTQPKGWMRHMARALGVRRSTLTMAVGGQRWQCIEDPAPVMPWRRWKPEGARA